MTDTFDVAVVGLGVNGAAAAWRCAEAGARVVAFDRFAPPHPFGSSSGRTRIIREAYFEGEAYVPLVRRAYDAWRLLEAEVGVPLFRRTGGLTIAPEGGGIVARVRAATERHGVELEVLDAEEIRARFPAFRVHDEDVAVWERRAGVLFPERCVESLMRSATRAGATLRLGTAVRSWTPEGDAVRIRHAGGDVLAGRLVLAAGSWSASLLTGIHLPVEVERQVLHWFEPASATLDPLDLPVFIEELEGGRMWYGIPEEGLLKVAYHHGGEIAPPDALRREVDPGEPRLLRKLLSVLIPEAAGIGRGARVCPYTNTPDGNFLIDRHPNHPQVVVASACSGHGFKFGPITGELVAGLVLRDDVESVPREFRWRW